MSPAIVVVMLLRVLGEPPAPPPAPPPALPASGPLEPLVIAPAPAPEPPALDPAKLAAALARLPTSPSLAEVQAAALREAGLATVSPRSMLRRTRAAAAAPKVSIQVDHRLDRGWVLDQEAGSADALRNDVGNQSQLRVDATWELDRLIFTPDELRTTRSVIDLADWRQRVLIEVTQLYFERQRLLLDDQLAPATDVETALDRALRLREVEGLLAAMTGLDGF
jgi:hypothetical protein